MAQPPRPLRSVTNWPGKRVPSTTSPMPGSSVTPHQSCVASGLATAIRSERLDRERRELPRRSPSGWTSCAPISRIRRKSDFLLLLPRPTSSGESRTFAPVNTPRSGRDSESSAEIFCQTRRRFLILTRSEKRRLPLLPLRLGRPPRAHLLRGSLPLRPLPRPRVPASRLNAKRRHRHQRRRPLLEDRPVVHPLRLDPWVDRIGWPLEAGSALHRLPPLLLASRLLRCLPPSPCAKARRASPKTRDPLSPQSSPINKFPGISPTHR